MNNYQNVAIFIDSLGGGGAEQVMLTLTNELLTRGHQVHFFLLENRIEYNLPSNLPVHVLYKNKSHRKSTSFFSLSQTATDMQALVKKLESEQGQFTLKLANLDPSCNVAERCGFSNTFYVLHNAMAKELKREAKLGPIKYWRKRFEKNAYNNKRIIAVSQGVADEAKSNKLIQPKSVNKIYNPIDFSHIQKQSLETNNELPKEDYLIHIGRVVKQKRHDILFQALQNIPNIKLVLLCKKVDKVRKLARKYKVEDRVITPGFQKNPYTWIKNAKALISASEFEGLGMNIIEALSLNTPVVSTDCDYGPRELLTGELNQFLVPVNDVQSLTNKIKQALDYYPQIPVTELKEKFSVKVAADNYLSLAAK